MGKRISATLLAMALVGFFGSAGGQEQEEEKTYDISLVKTAEVDREIRQVDDKKVLTETVTVQKGDWIWKILRQKGLLTDKNFPQLLWENVSGFFSLKRRPKDLAEIGAARN